MNPQDKNSLTVVGPLVGLADGNRVGLRLGPFDGSCLTGSANAGVESAVLLCQLLICDVMHKEHSHL